MMQNMIPKSLKGMKFYFTTVYQEIWVGVGQNLDMVQLYAKYYFKVKIAVAFYAVWRTVLQIICIFIEDYVVE
uniref:Uncharacterized protein n=1 Tax=Melopsittacus undulatus TaxID=13146 RepID=A0A8C6N7K2_MELUD